MSSALLLSQNYARPSERGFNMRPLHEIESDRNVRQMHTPFTPYGTIERNSQQDAFFRESLGGAVRQLVEEYVLETAGPLLSAVNVYPATNPNDLRIQVATLTMKPGMFRPAASFSAPHYLTQRETRAEVTAKRFILGLYMESLFTQTAMGITRLIYAMRQVAYAWLRTMQYELAQTMMAAAPVMAHIVTQLNRQTDPEQRSKDLREACLLYGALFMLPSKDIDGNVRLRQMLNTEARRRLVAPPSAIYVPEGARLEVGVTPELLRASTYSEQVASMALQHNMPKGSYIEVPPVQLGDSVHHAFEEVHPIGLVHPGADPAHVMHNVNPNEMPIQLYSTTIADYATRQMVTVHLGQALRATGLWDGNGRITDLGKRFFGQGLGGNENGTFRAYLAHFKMDVLTGFEGNADLSVLDRPIFATTLPQILAHVASGGICPVGYYVLRHLQVRTASAVATSGKPLSAIVGSVETDQTKTLLLEHQATMVATFGASITDHDRMFRVPAQVPIAHLAGGEIHENTLAHVGVPSEVASFRQGRSNAARSWIILAAHPGEPSHIARLGVLYPKSVDPATLGVQLRSAVAYNGSDAVCPFAREATVGEVLSAGKGMLRPASYLIDRTLGAELGATGQPCYTLVRCNSALFGVNATAESLWRIFSNHI
jgi:hypothetical protein